MSKKEPVYGLTEQKVADIRNAYRDGMTLSELHQFFNVPEDRLISILRHRPWNPQEEQVDQEGQDETL